MTQRAPFSKFSNPGTGQAKVEKGEKPLLAAHPKNSLFYCLQAVSRKVGFLAASPQFGAPAACQHCEVLLPVGEKLAEFIRDDPLY